MNKRFDDLDMLIWKVVKATAARSESEDRDDTEAESMSKKTRTEE